MKIQKEFIRNFLGDGTSVKAPNIWISEIYKIQDDNIWFGRHKEAELYERVRKFIDKDELTELVKFEWLLYFWPKLRIFASKAIAEDRMIFSSKNDLKKPDIFMDQEWYEFCFAKLDIFRYKNGEEFEMSLVNSQDKGNLEKLRNSPDTMTFGNGSIQFSPVDVAIEKYKKVALRISEKALKNYLVEESINLVIFADRNMNNDIFMQPLGVKYLFDNHFEDIENALKKFKKIFFCMEDKITNPDFLKSVSRNEVIRAVSFFVDKYNLYEFKNKTIDELTQLFYHSKTNYISIKNK